MHKGLHFFVFVVLLAAVLSGCNVYDFTHAEGRSDDVSVLLSDAASAQGNDDYAGAARIYWKTLGKDPDNSRAMKGYTTALIYRDVELSDIPKLMISVFQVDTIETDDFFSDIAGRPGTMTMPEYKASVLVAASNASYWRSAIHGINPANGVITTDAYGLPDATGVSDGRVSADDRTAFFNYLILKSIHIALYVQQEFAVYGSLSAGIDLNAYTNNYSTVTSSNAFRLWHIDYTNRVHALSNSYSMATNVVLGTGRNTSILNFIGTIDAFIAVVSNQQYQGDISQDIYVDLSGEVDDLKVSFYDLTFSLTNTASGVQDGFNQLSSFLSTAEGFAAGNGWFPYAY